MSCSLQEVKMNRIILSAVVNLSYMPKRVRIFTKKLLGKGRLNSPSVQTQSQSSCPGVVMLAGG